MINSNEAIIKFEHVKKYFPKNSEHFRKAYLKAINDVSFEINRGEILAIVGESGCGKSTLAKMLCKIHETTNGHIYVEGKDIARKMSTGELFDYRNKVQMIFQDPFGSLNPAHKVSHIVGRAIELHNSKVARNEVIKKSMELLETVGLTPATDFMEKHPNQLSGGQRQRIAIARVLAVNPSIIVADEPTSMLDVSIGIDIMNLLIDLKKNQNLTFMYITHNLASARYIADRMVVMYAGTCVEIGNINDVIEKPLHPYTMLLLASTPEPYRKEEYTIHAPEDLPDLTTDKSMCLFCARCPKATERCCSEMPADYQVGNRKVKCFLYENAKDEYDIKLDASIYYENNNKAVEEMVY